MNPLKLSAPAVQTRDLVKIFGDNYAVNGVDLEIPSGGIYGVLGPNDAGKITTIQMLTTLLKPDRGSAKVFGFDVVRDSHIVRQLIGVTGQYASIDEKLSATENLFIFSRLLGLSSRDAKRKTSELPEEFGLTEAAKRPLAQYSGGMHRKIDLAASLINQPPLIFLDEPTTGLDPRTRNQMWNTIRRLVSEGSTVVLTTQYLDEADQLADRIAVIDRGKVIAEGTPAELKARVGRASLELVMADPENIPRATDIIQQILLTEVHVTATDVITAPLADAEFITDILLALRGAHIELAGVSVKSPSLDEVFLTLTGHQTGQKLQRLTIKTNRMHFAGKQISRSTSIALTVRQSLIMAHRGLLKVRRTPEQLIDVTIQPILFTLMFAYLFGGAIAGNVHAYLPIIIPGILAQTVLTGSIAIGVNLREDMDKGVFDRFRSRGSRPLRVRL
jgi:ABC-2 type transport system ATP-binding protein